MLFFIFVLAVDSELLAQKNKKSNSKSPYGNASYAAENAGDFFRTWLLAGPISVSEDSEDSPDEATQERAFKEDWISGVDIVPKKAISSLKIGNKEYQWKEFVSGDDLVDLDKFYEEKDFAYAYALAEIISPEDKNVILAVGSDDGVKVWHNSKLVHDNWIPRGLEKDSDLIPLKLVKGSNQILMKVQDIELGWGFSVRILDKNSINEQLITASGTGNLEKIKFLLESGAEVNFKQASGFTALHNALMHGFDDVAALLKEHGALGACRA